MRSAFAIGFAVGSAAPVLMVTPSTARASASILRESDGPMLFQHPLHQSAFSERLLSAVLCHCVKPFGMPSFALAAEISVRW
jgi:hypothetical protein